MISEAAGVVFFATWGEVFRDDVLRANISNQIAARAAHATGCGDRLTMKQRIHLASEKGSPA